MSSTIPADEAGRLLAVRRYDILDTPTDGAFDRITALAARRFGVPIAIISIVDRERIWFKSRHGIDVAEIGRDPGLCASAILGSAPHIVTDARIDPRTLANPLVAGAFGLRFYAAVPLTTGDGYNLGTLCVIGHEPREVTADEIADLEDLAAIVMDQLDLRLAARLAVTRAELAAKEIDHRVMNGLQFVSSLLTLQSRTLEDEAASSAVQLAAARVAAVAQVHRNFLEEAGEASCGAFVKRLCGDLARVLEREIVVESDDAEVPTTALQAIGLIINELVTNAAKHGAGRICVSCRLHDGQHVLTVADEGEGLPPGFDLAQQSRSLGMKVVTTLAGQLRGSVTARNSTDGHGAVFRVAFPSLSP
ncbi:histidine kinase dimerization/phosphoacceptor domain -containing protein [Sphingobium sp.]|uniref:sensor histidine kinase n=1 Tax=Sphingobium sp. TaxID=1912891 RepID=UPI000DB23CEA|nr:histidine kinase dimerization/phosphoacceptor domain -containing protein [Sphingobium sp.]PZU69332.1 MAG: hypothetical protein DI540_05155 [Sphingobium sp.]